MKHFLALDPCPLDHAYRYLVLRELKKSYVVYLVHQEGKTRKYMKVADIKKTSIDIHGRSNLVSRDAGSFENRLCKIQSIVSELIQESRHVPTKQDSIYTAPGA